MTFYKYAELKERIGQQRRESIGKKQGMITLEVKLKTNVMDLQKKYVAGHGSVDTATIQELDGSQKNSVKANLST